MIRICGQEYPDRKIDVTPGARLSTWLRFFAQLMRPSHENQRVSIGRPPIDSSMPLFRRLPAFREMLVKPVLGEEGTEKIWS